jgi:hypothetical protein
MLDVPQKLRAQRPATSLIVASLQQEPASPGLWSLIKAARSALPPARDIFHAHRQADGAEARR